MTSLPLTKDLKVLIVSSPMGKIDTCVAKITAQHKKGNFDVCFIVGDLLAEGSDGKELEGVEFPLPTYTHQSLHPLPPQLQAKIAQNIPLAKNLTGVGKVGAVTTVEGLKVGFVGGKWGVGEFGEEAGGMSDPYLHSSDLTTLLHHPLLLSCLPPPSPPTFTSLKSAPPPSTRGLDLLLLSTPPPLLHPLDPPGGLPQIADLVKATRPRYVVYPAAGGEGFWEGEPFGWEGGEEGVERVTRGFRLDSWGRVLAEGEKRGKWIYAYLQTASTPASAFSQLKLRPNPYTTARVVKRQALEGQNYIFAGVNGAQGGGKRVKTAEDAPPGANYVCKICNNPGHWIELCPDRKVREPVSEHVKCHNCGAAGHVSRSCTQPSPSKHPSNGSRDTPPNDYKCNSCGMEGLHYYRECPVNLEKAELRRVRNEQAAAEECWFCLSGKHVAKHLIADIGEEVYMALPKGALIPTGGGATPLVPGGGHVLIVPIGHFPTVKMMPLDDALTVTSEINNLKSRLSDLYKAHGCELVSFEINRLAGRGGHAHVQIVPVPKGVAMKVKEAFEQEGQAVGYEWEVDNDVNKVQAGVNFLRVDVPGVEGPETMIHLTKAGFDLQFPRRVLARLLKVPQRANWRDCPEDEKQQTRDTGAFKKALKATRK